MPPGFPKRLFVLRPLLRTGVDSTDQLEERFVSEAIGYTKIGGPAGIRTEDLLYA